MAAIRHTFGTVIITLTPLPTIHNSSEHGFNVMPVDCKSGYESH